MASNNQQVKPIVAMARQIDTLKKQLALALPKHLNADRMARLVLTQFSVNPELMNCSFDSIAGAIMNASQMGLEIGVGGQGWLIPYGRTATFIPGWQGLVDLCNRSGRASVWTASVRPGADFRAYKGTKPHIDHDDSDEDPTAPITHVYAVGWVKNAAWPNIEVWNRRKIEAHRDQYNKQGKKHYSFANENNFEMYGRKVALLQVLKYMPKSVELTAAIDASNAVESGGNYTIDGDFFVMPTSAGSDQGDMPAEDLMPKQTVVDIPVQTVAAGNQEPQNQAKTSVQPKTDGNDAMTPQIASALKSRLAKKELTEGELFNVFGVTDWAGFKMNDSLRIQKWINSPGPDAPTE